MAAGSANGMPGQDNEGSGKSLTFTVDFDDHPPKNPRRMPKQLSSSKMRGKRKISEESITEKQKQAEERRKKLIEDRLDRIHQLEEEAQRMAQAMAPMLKSSNGEPSVRKLHKDSDVVSAATDGESQSQDNGMGYLT